MSHATLYSVRELDLDDAYDVLHGEVFADYVCDYTRDELEKMYDNTFCRPGLRWDGRRLIIVSKAEFFHIAWDQFKVNLGKLEECTFEDFCRKEPDGAWLLREAAMPRYVDWVVTDDGGYMALDDWVRRHEEGDSIELPFAYDFHY